MEHLNVIYLIEGILQLEINSRDPMADICMCLLMRESVCACGVCVCHYKI